MQCTYFIFLLRKYKGSLHLILNGHGECTVILSVLFTCLIDLLQLLFIDLVWYGVVWFSVYCICEAFLYTCVVFDFCIGLSYVFCFLLKKKSQYGIDLLLCGKFLINIYFHTKLSFPTNVSRNPLSRQDSFLEMGNRWGFNSFLLDQYLFHQ